MKGPLRLGAIMVAVLALESAVVTYARTWTGSMDIFACIRFWCLFMGAQVVLFAVVGLFGPRKGFALALALLGGCFVVAVWLLAIPLLIGTGLVPVIVPNTPVTP